MSCTLVETRHAARLSAATRSWLRAAATGCSVTPMVTFEVLKNPRAAPASQASGSRESQTLVRSWLPEDGASGSVVAVLGYGPTARAGRCGFEESVLAAAAKSFVVAVRQGQLTVDCSVDGVNKASLDKKTLAAALSPVRDQQRRRLGLGVLGREAWAAYETLQTGMPCDGRERGSMVSVCGCAIWRRGNERWCACSVRACGLRRMPRSCNTPTSRSSHHSARW